MLNYGDSKLVTLSVEFARQMSQLYSLSCLLFCYKFVPFDPYCTVNIAKYYRTDHIQSAILLFYWTMTSKIRAMIIAIRAGRIPTLRAAIWRIINYYSHETHFRRKTNVIIHFTIFVLIRAS